MKNYNTKESGMRIRTLRKAAGYTQEELAARLSLDRSYLGQAETGKRGCSVDVLIRLSEVFGVSLDYLVLGDRTDRDMAREKLDELIQTLTAVRNTL